MRNWQRKKRKPSKITKAGKIEKIDFAEWLRNEKMEGHIVHLNSMRHIALGLLYGAQTFFVINLFRFLVVSFVFIFVQSLSRNFSSHFLHSLFWLCLSVAFAGICGVVFVLYRQSFEAQQESLWELYLKTKAAVDSFHVKVASNLEEACRLIEAGYEHVSTIGGKRIYQKRK